MKYLFILSLSFFLFSCESSNKPKTNDAKKHQLHFSIDSIAESTYVLSINRPFVGTRNTEKYCLYPKEMQQPKLKGITHFIATPVERIVITSTTHLGFLEPLNQLKSIVGATNLSLFYSNAFQQKVKAGEIKSIGKARINEEALIQLNADVVFAYAIDAGEMKKVEQLRNLGQQVVLISEYMEQKPLDKAAWINFMAPFFGDSIVRQADKNFKQIKDRYYSVKTLALSAKKKPEVMMGYPWKGNWYVSGGISFQAAFFDAANAKYVWKSLNQEGSVPLATETVINDALNADFWFNCGDQQHLSSIVAEDKRLERFKAFQENHIYNNYKRSNSFGANDYWESGVVRPDLILSDLIKILHPNLLATHELVYYKQLN